MTEHDAFDVRLGAAVHGYVGSVSSGLDPAEFAHRIAASSAPPGSVSSLSIPDCIATSPVMGSPVIAISMARV